MDNLIKIGIGSKASELTGIGTEYLVVNGVCIAKFWNGNIVTAVALGNNEVTKTAA